MICHLGDIDITIVDEIIRYFSDIFHLSTQYELPLNIVNALNRLDRVQRGELKSKLFNVAKRLGQGGDATKAITWLETSFDQIEKYSFRLHDVLFSPGQDIPENIVFYLSNAKQSIEICVFTISDELLSRALLAAVARGVKVRLITDNNKMRDHGSQVKALARAGVEVRVDNSRYHMHNKFGIIDGRIAFTGSYNWTYTAKAYNQENLVVTTNYTIVHKFIDEFSSLWVEMFPLTVKQMRDGRLKAIVHMGKKAQEVETLETQALDDDDEERVPAPQTDEDSARQRRIKKNREKKKREWQDDAKSSRKSKKSRHNRRR
ncbi:MAG: DUF1669 domain-containing protein [Bacteroidales bacterium]|nr:DUF1669 domain-containing protein [Bacteroidales bacterium]